ncbi:hypothetical protein Nepgr_006192 [Nepenthes gracilis]|uniref:Uncharacterized protein n=1 Tax=Nepenthes gracilis TaxID=150966 RepID=A0AAD3S4N9_NEPGR|nr:hypothetical protein Nepgr_006192 [Nepenthes gracilis]
MPRMANIINQVTMTFIRRNAQEPSATSKGCMGLSTTRTATTFSWPQDKEPKCPRMPAQKTRGTRVATSDPTASDIPYLQSRRPCMPYLHTVTGVPVTPHCAVGGGRPLTK